MGWTFNEVLGFTALTFYIVSLMVFALLNYRDAEKARRRLTQLLETNVGSYLPELRPQLNRE